VGGTFKIRKYAPLFTCEKRLYTKLVIIIYVHKVYRISVSEKGLFAFLNCPML
jgi:hypothetical protein